MSAYIVRLRQLERLIMALSYMLSEHGGNKSLRVMKEINKCAPFRKNQ